MPRTIRGKRMRKLRVLSRVLKRWIQDNIQCARAWEVHKDVPWWYNERALLSVLAGAVWQERGIAIEEFRTEKRGWRKKARHRLGAGRQDLFISFRGAEFIAEAKYCWSCAGSRGTNPKLLIQKRLNAARADIRRTPPYGSRRLGLVFAVPYLRRSELASADELIENWLKRAREVDYSCCAWVFPGHSRTIREGGRIFPGLALFVREVRR